MEFIRLSHYVHGLLEEFLIECFTSGLKDSMKFEIMAKQPKSIEDARRLVQLKEVKNLSIKKSGKFNFNKSQGLLLATPTKPAPTSGSSSTGTFVKKLSNQEYKERREKGLCFHCEEKFIPRHKCKNKKLMQLQIVANVEEDSEWADEVKSLLEIIRKKTI